MKSQHHKCFLLSRVVCNLSFLTATIWHCQSNHIAGNVCWMAPCFVCVCDALQQKSLVQEMAQLKCKSTGHCNWLHPCSIFFSRGFNSRNLTVCRTSEPSQWCWAPSPLFQVNSKQTSVGEIMRQGPSLECALEKPVWHEWIEILLGFSRNKCTNNARLICNNDTIFFHAPQTTGTVCPLKPANYTVSNKYISTGATRALVSGILQGRLQWRPMSSLHMQLK